MSERPKQPFVIMMKTARLLVTRLAPACERIEIAGSLRRKKALVSDIELVAIPKPVVNLLGEPTGDRTELDALLDTLPVHFTKRGRKYQQFWFDGTQLPFYVDLFLPLPECWAVVYMIRTGSADFSRRMVTAQSQGGYMPDGYRVQDGRVWVDGRALDIADERALFGLWGMDYIEPEDRA
jgi:DNA polymerase/3'-5' exonuclease PolX